MSEHKNGTFILPFNLISTSSLDAIEDGVVVEEP